MKQIPVLSLLLVFWGMLPQSASSAQLGKPQVGDTQLTRLHGFLCEGSGGIVRLGTPFAAFGPGQQWAGIIEHRLGSGLTNRFAPLINHVDWLRNMTRLEVMYCGGGHLAVSENHGAAMTSTPALPTLFVDLNVKMRLVEKRSQREKNRLGDDTWLGAPHWIYEIEEAELIQAEEMSPAFLRAWRDLDGTLHAIVETSLQPNTPAKQTRLAEVIEQGSRALSTMATQRSTPPFRELVRAIEPKAYATRRFQVEGAQQWREQFELYSARLGIVPQTPLPVQKDYPVAKWIRDSESLEVMLRTVRETGDDNVWLQRIPFPVYWYRNGSTSHNLPLSQLPNLANADFERLRDEARKPDGKAVTNSAAADTHLVDLSKPISSKELGVVLKFADTNLLRRHLLVAGWVVSERLPDGPDNGLMPGDLLPGYKSVFDIVISRWDTWLRHSLMLGEQKVFRGDKVFTVQGAK